MIPMQTSNRPIVGDHELFRGVLPDKSFQVPLSAAGLQASRLAACRDGSFVFASGSQAFVLNCSPTRKRARPVTPPDKEANETPENSKRNPVASAVSSAIADDYMVPRPFSWLEAVRSPVHSAHRAEIQSVVADHSRIATVDAYGRCIITSCIAAHLGDGKDDDKETETDSLVLTPTSFRHGSRGWAGVSLDSNQPKSAAVARQFFRDVTFFDANVPVRTIYTILPPQAVSFCQELGAVAVAEGGDLTFYDSRAGENRGCISRKTAGVGNLLSVDVCDKQRVVASAGMDRVVTIFDVRMMNIRDRWGGCLKYECSATLLSREMDGMAYVCSVDNELACGAWSADMAAHMKSLNATQSLMISGANTKSPRRAFGFRADVRLIGMARRMNGGEEIGVMSESGAFYLLRRKPE